MKKMGIKNKIIISTLLCVILVSLFGNILLYNYMRGVITEQSDKIRSVNLSAVSSQISASMENALNLSIQCANDNQIINVMSASNEYNKDSITVQNKLTAYLNTYPGSPYVNKLLVFNEDGFIIQSSNQQLYGSAEDSKHLLSLPELSLLEGSKDRFASAMVMVPGMDPKSISAGGRAVAAICRIQKAGSGRRVYTYLEISTELFESILESYTTNVFMTAVDGELITSTPELLPEDFSLSDTGRDGSAVIGKRRYLFEKTPLPYAGMSLYMFSVIPAGLNDSLIYPLLIVCLITLNLAAVLSLIISRYLSRPIERLNMRLKRISENDLSYDPEIEASPGELGVMGHTVNDMVLSISQLLKETKQLYETRQSIEISLLQSQVNPHFLYNTLDTIRWMAVIQKNKGIEQTSLRLINLLKNIAKGTQDKISLREELSLLTDYIEIQNTRYMEMFAFVNNIPEELLSCNIVKFTLQPLVENAIFHGIEPAGRWGTITLGAEDKGDELYISIHDDGVGIPEEKLDIMLIDGGNKISSGLSGMGIANVHQRIRLLYGEAYGLSIESETGENSFTKITVRIPKEQ